MREEDRERNRQALLGVIQSAASASQDCRHVCVHAWYIQGSLRMRTQDLPCGLSLTEHSATVVPLWLD